MVFLRSFFACASGCAFTASLGCALDAEHLRLRANELEEEATSSGGASGGAAANRRWPAAQQPSDLERVFVVAQLPPLPRPPRSPFDRRVCELGSPAEVDPLDGGNDAAPSADDASPNARFELPELGRPCGEGCSATSCYEAPSGNSICTRPCTGHAECGSTGVCQAIGNAGASLCFRRCQSDAECLAVNAVDTPGFGPAPKPDAGNPLVCRATKNPSDPYFGQAHDDDPDFCHRLCVQRSEP